MSQKFIDLSDAKILIVDDVVANRNLLCETLESAGYAVSAAPDGEVALKIASIDVPDLILLDIMMPGMDGFEVCRRLKDLEATRDVPIVFITAIDEVASVVKGFETGGVDYITKPFKIDEILIRVKTHLEMKYLTSALAEKNQELRSINERLELEIYQRKQAEDAKETADAQLSILSQREVEHWGIEGFIGQSKTFAKILKDIQRLHKFSMVNVIITGESGTGKELIARAIHFGGPKAKGPFIPVNCSAIPGELAESLLFGHVKGSFTGANTARKGYFELAHGGTLFLDEIGDMPLELQAKLLRTLEDGIVIPLGATQGRKVEARVVAATNAELQETIKNKKFRQDLFFRLARFTVEIAPLRERKDDVPLLINHFLNILSKEMGVSKPGISPVAFKGLIAYEYPGNIRELKNIIERAVIESEGDLIQPEHLHFFYGAEPDFSQEITVEAVPPPQVIVPPSPPLPDSKVLEEKNLSDEEKILKYVREHTSINNTECRQLLVTERNRASYLLKKLHGSGRLKCEGQGRWMIYKLAA
ncbi:MAG TPA: sigma-54-dependent Fis family transcriptional regulator [Verrucomicrobiales bacterium]|nr:sigma-54-dependent Fis family transcriptional regulator [Verrucomicrobiales bacterium]HIL70419.1 sigma-54-dependent Fis family transcriptional regulator [Verrucomicrobiota bacterium]